jgi:hypothetical protein
MANCLAFSRIFKIESKKLLVIKDSDVTLSVSLCLLNVPQLEDLEDFVSNTWILSIRQSFVLSVFD